MTNEVEIGKINRIKFGEVVRTYTLIPEQREGVSVVIRHGVPLEQATNDAINGITGIATRLGKKEKIKVSWLSDARTLNSPDDDNGGFAGEVIWDLGENLSPDERELEEVSIWIKSDDRARCDYSGMLEISEGGNVFFPLEGTYTNVNFYELFGRGFSGTYNNVRYYFASGAVTGFRYVKFKAFPAASNHNESRFVEVDVFVNWKKPASPGVVGVHLIDGTALVGILKRFDSNGIVVSVEKSDITVPLIGIEKVTFRNIPVELKERISSDRIGILMNNGDFIEGEVKEVDNDIVSLYSTLLGVKKFSIRLNVTAIIFRKPKPADFNIKVVTKYGSEILAEAVEFMPDSIKLKEYLLGVIELHYDKLAEIQILKAR